MNALTTCRVPPSFAGTCTVFGDHCFVNLGNCNTACLDGDGSALSTASASSCATVESCPEPLVADTECAGFERDGRTLMMDIFDENGDTSLCIRLDVDFNALSGGACTVEAMSSTAVASAVDFVGTYTSCSAVVNSVGMVEDLQLTGGPSAQSIEFDTTALCGVAVSLDVGVRKRQPGALVTTSSALSFGTLASATGDPHLRAPNGDKYDFVGLPMHTYAFFTTPKFALNARLAHRTMRGALYIDMVGLVIGGVSYTFSTGAYRQHVLQKKLAAHYANVDGVHFDVTDYRVSVHVCLDHRIDIEQRQASVPGRGTVYYLDVAVHTPGCHDAYGGALGVSYRCAYVDRHSFDWTQFDEKSFQVDSLTDISGYYEQNKVC